ncbi:MAG TPA: Stp1/IreP family PP2C-type Ser/Thr phosphatase [Actinomycetota bacterium]
MRIEAGVATHVGQVRTGNEDAYLLEPPLYAVADGMGGHRGGEVASQLALTTIAESFRKGQEPFADQVQEANRAVFERSGADRAVAGMGTTLTAAVIEGNLAHLVHVGDSRAYLLRAGSLRQLTDDHTLVNRMVKAGEITPGEAEVHPHRNVLVRALGTESDVELDEQDVGLLEGDRLLLCSDGLTGMLTEEQIQAILGSTQSAPQEAADRLVVAANRAGGVDNITVVVLDVLQDEGADDVVGAPVPMETKEAEKEEPSRPARTPEPRRRWRRVAIIVGIVVVVLGAAFTGARALIDTRWYVGVADGKVAIYQGIPADMFGYDLSHVVEVTDISASAAEQIPFWASLAGGINVDSRADADARVEQIRKDVDRAAHTRTGGQP